MVTEQTPKIGDVKSQSDGTTSFYTARELKGLQPSTGNAIPLNAMAGDVPVPKVTQPQPGQTGPALETQMGAVGNEFTRNLETQRAQAQTNEQASFQSYLDSVLNAPTQAGAEAKAYEKSGVNVLQEQLNDQAGQLRSEQDFLRTRTEQVQKNMEGMSAQAIQDEVNRVRNESLSRQASISVNLLTAQSRFDSAKAVADRYVDSVMEQSERKSAALQTMYERNFNLFSKTEQREFETKQADRLQAQQAQRENLQRLQDTKLEALKMATLNNAPADVRSLVASAQTPEEVYQYGGQWVGADLLDREAKRASISSENASAASAWASVRQKEVETALALAEKGDTSAIKKLGYNPQEVNGGVEGARDYELEKTSIEMGKGAAAALLNNLTGIKLSTGAFQTPLGTALTQAVGGGAAAGGVTGSIIPGAGTLLGGAAGAVAGLAATPFFYSRTKTAKDEALASASFLINDSTFKSIMELRAQGVTFGAMTEGERIAAGRAATELAAAAVIDESGQVTGFRGGADTIKRYVADIQKAYEGRQEYLDQKYAIKPEEDTEAQEVWNKN